MLLYILIIRSAETLLSTLATNNSYFPTQEHYLCLYNNTTKEVLVECRNPALQQMFMLIGRAEKAGSGVDKILSGWKKSHWRKPFIEITSQPDRIILTLPMFNVLPQKVLTALNETYSENIQHLSPDELTVLAFCQIEGVISNQRLQYVLNMHSTDITKLLKKLVEEHYLESDNNGRWTIYKLSQKVDTSEKVATSKKLKDTDNQEERDVKVATSIKKIATSKKSKDTDNQEERDIKIATSIKKGDTFEKVATFKKSKDADYQEETNVNIAIYYGKSLKKNELHQIIMDLCNNNYLTKEELATYLGKSINYVRNKIIPTMIKEKKIEKKYPHTINHPNQSYKTTKKYAK